METKKIAFACFVGGVLCCMVALSVAPVFWWLGILAGLAGGYIGYEAREFLKAIPVAFLSTCRGGAKISFFAVAGLRSFFAKPHPFLYPAAFLGFIVQAALMGPEFAREVMRQSHLGLFACFLYIELFVMFTLASLIVINFFAFFGAREVERCYWLPLQMLEESQSAAVEKQLKKQGLHPMPASYSNVLRWIAKGVGFVLFFVVWTLWKELAITVWEACCLLVRFAWQMFKLVHSEKRVLCAIDGTIGGAVSYMWSPPLASFPEQVMFVIFGGLLGAALGVANWEIVSKRILRLVPENNT